jgi:hypothetical protein
MDGIVTDAETIIPAGGGRDSFFEALSEAGARKKPVFP